MGKKKRPQDDPWYFPALVSFPETGIEVEYLGPTEIAMGSPLASPLKCIRRGDLEIRPEGLFGGPPVCDPESGAVALPEWTGIKQRIRIFRPAGGLSQVSKETYRVLHLKRFENGRLTGVDSPVFEPQPVDVVVNEGFSSNSGLEIYSQPRH